MMDKRIRTLAENLIHYSVALAPEEKILIEVTDEGYPLAKALVEEAYRAGGVPFLTVKRNELQRALLMQATEEQLIQTADYEARRMRDMDAYLAIRASNNINALSDVPAEKMGLYQKHWYGPVHGQIRVPETKWCVMRYPGGAMAQLANMSTEAFEDFYFNVCNLDYARMDRAMTPLVKLTERTDRVHIKGPGTDLSFSIRGMTAVKCSGRRNIPDGEVYTAPIRNSVQGTLAYNVPAVYQGTTFEHVALTFRDGRIVDATANLPEKINRIFDTDEGARYIGEFSFGLNPYIAVPMKDTLFDEKIFGSFHFTPGRAYKAANNGNDSAIHWDLICIQRPEYGGGEIYFDDVLIRKDGRFVIEELQGLNPEHLK